MVEKRKAGRPFVEGLTTTQERMLKLIEQYIGANGIPPTMVELATQLKIKAASAHEIVGQLVKKGYLAREPRKARNLRIVRRSKQSASRLVEIPIVGRVAAGCPIFAEENVSGHLCVDASAIGSGRHFALQVTGDSMVNADIRDGNLVIVKQQAIANNREIVVACLDGHVTVKRLFVNDGAIQLLPENKEYNPIHVDPDSDFRILGRVVGVRIRD